MKKVITMLIISVACVSQATLYFYDSFNYTANTGLRAQTGYSVSGSGGMATNRAGSLTYAGLPTSAGGKIELYGYRPNAPGNVNRFTWTTGNSDTNLFASFILNVATVGTLQSNSFIFSIRNGNSQFMITNNASNPLKYNVGIYQRIGGTTVKWDDNGGNGYDPSVNYFVVMSFTNATGTNIASSLWMNPTLGQSSPGTPLFSIAASAVSSPSNYFGFGNGNGNPNEAGRSVIYLDELRYGSTWADVTPIPEPATIGMLGLGALVTIMVRRRRS